VKADNGQISHTFKLFFAILTVWIIADSSTINQRTGIDEITGFFLAFNNSRFVVICIHCLPFK
jgi:hypothetical protein